MGLLCLGCRLLMCATLVAAGNAGAAPARWVAKSLPEGGKTRYGQHYLVALPAGYADEPARRWPVVMFLHGAGEWGTRLDRVKTQGLPAWIDAGHEVPAIVVAPQSPAGQMWHPLFVDAVLNDVAVHWRTDPQRITLTGLSMGGMGTVSTALAYPRRFAALAPVAGGLPNDIVAWQRAQPFSDLAEWLPPLTQLRGLPWWVAHGTADPVVPFAMAERLAKGLDHVGATARLHWMKGVGHDAWTPTYADNPAFYDWLLAQRSSVAPEYSPPPPDPAIAGRYRAPSGHTITARIGPGRLELSDLVAGEREDFLPIDGQRFIGTVLIRVVFRDGRATVLRVPGLGDFARVSATD